MKQKRYRYETGVVFRKSLLKSFYTMTKGGTTPLVAMSLVSDKAYLRGQRDFMKWMAKRERT